MQATVTIKVKLSIADEGIAAIEATQAAYVTALNLTSDVAYDKQCKNAVALHHLTYQTVRERTGLPSNLVCSARAVVSEAYKREMKHHLFGPHVAVRYDERTLTLDIAREYATLSTLSGRVRVGLILSDYHRQYLDGRWMIAHTAALKQKNRVWYLHLTLTREIPDARGPETIGVDSGIKRVATVNTGKVFKGGRIKQLRRRRFHQRRSLKRHSEGQSRSRNRRRLLKRLSEREKRAVEWMLWNIANEIVREAIKANASAIAVEDLKHIRERIRVAKKQRLIQHGWPFSSLIAKIRHVASKAGIRVIEVDARNTSKRCSRCGHCDRGNRKSQSDFRCLRCGYSHNADLNASFNIRHRHVCDGCAASKPARECPPPDGCCVRSRQGKAATL
ncbi:MAG: transposase [Acidobacteriota bacterium]